MVISRQNFLTLTFLILLFFLRVSVFQMLIIGSKGCNASENDKHSQKTRGNSRSPPIRLIMGTKGNKLDGIVEAVRAIGTEHKSIVPPLSTDCAVKENNQKIASDGAAIETTKIPFKRFTQRHRAFADHLHLFSDGFFYCAVFFQRSDKIITENQVHLKTSS